MYISAPVEVKPEPTGKSSAGKARGGKNNPKDTKGVRSRPESQVSNKIIFLKNPPQPAVVYIQSVNLLNCHYFRLSLATIVE